MDCGLHDHTLSLAQGRPSSSAFCCFTDSLTREHKQKSNLDPGVTGKGDVFTGIQRFRARELIPSSIPHRRDFNFSWIVPRHPEKIKTSGSARNVSGVCLTSQCVRAHEARGGGALCRGLGSFACWAHRFPTASGLWLNPHAAPGTAVRPAAAARHGL